MVWENVLAKFKELFGVDFVLEGKCPDGSDYTWKKRRR